MSNFLLNFTGSRAAAYEEVSIILPECLLKATTDTFKDLRLLVSENILKCFAHNCFPDWEALHLHTKRITTDLASWSLVSYLFFISDVNADRINIDVAASRMSISRIKPLFKTDTLMLLDNTEKVPFRLTRSLVEFISPLKTALFPAAIQSILGKILLLFLSLYFILLCFTLI